MGGMDPQRTYKEYRSPRHKLLQLFETSRDQWREKCKTAKARLKVERIRTRRLREQRDRWRERADELEALVLELQENRPPPVALDP